MFQYFVGDRRSSNPTSLKPGFHMICNGRRRSAIMTGNQSALYARHMETIKTLSGTVCDTRSELIGRVEFDSTFPTIVATPTMKYFNGTRVWDGV